MMLETDALNAFATGNKVGDGTIVVTRGLLGHAEPRRAARAWWRTRCPTSPISIRATW